MVFQSIIFNIFYKKKQLWNLQGKLFEKNYLSLNYLARSYAQSNDISLPFGHFRDIDIVEIGYVKTITNLTITK